MKVPQHTLKFNLNKKEEQKILNILSKGWKTNVNIPDFKEIRRSPSFSSSSSSSTSMAIKMPLSNSNNNFPLNIPVDYFKIIGSDEFFINPNTQNREIKTIVKMADQGIIIENGTVDGGQLRLPWKAILNADKKGNNIILDLIYDQTLKFSGPPVYREIKQSLRFILKFINDHIKKD
ncbi:MAG: hypothetical protein LBM96_02070 [Methanobrevibacter sp.]|jgi:hypothetical protein|nr:hypothetical protein [Candidatus Methanoflexus mossambicus]